MVRQVEQFDGSFALARKFLRCFALGCVATFIVLIAVPYGLFKIAEDESRMAHVPADLEVTKILYRNEENWGSVLLPLPGDNETGILMYDLPDAIVRKIGSEGLGFFNRPENVERRVGHQQTHSEWHETPIADGEGGWSVSKFGRKISGYLNQYGFGIDVDKSVEALVDDAISTPGSFYSHGRTGLVIVIPKLKRVIFAYAG
ncbi:MAG: hypothetical protein K2X57_20985 [Xanthobacteraceae bacterium]|nr:hypothetical protein [Xanthobacteraceae bacterium]